jgi:predicted transglutaminase-like cysteine proteinase
MLVGALGTSACASNAQSLLPPPSTPMSAGIPQHDPPPGFIGFCVRFADQCSSVASEPDTVTLDVKTWDLMNTVNASWNYKIIPEHDEQHYGRVEFWTIPSDDYGDCKDYALAKRKELAEKGLPMKALRVAIVVTRQGERHAVLTLATDKGDYVLDNLTGEIRPWYMTGYQWLGRQDPRDDLGWVAFNGTATQLAELEPTAAPREN